MSTYLRFVDYLAHPSWVRTVEVFLTARLKTKQATPQFHGEDFKKQSYGGGKGFVQSCLVWLVENMVYP